MPFSIKIYSIAAGILLLLVLLSWFSYNRVSLVAGELKEITNYLIPLEDIITNIDVHSIEQKIHLERMWRFYETKPTNFEKINAEKALFENRGNLVDQEITHALELMKKAIAYSEVKEDILAFVYLQTMINNIEREHQGYHDHVLEIIEAINQNQQDEAHLLQDRLESENGELNDALETVFLGIKKFTEHKARTTEKHEGNVLYFNTILVIMAVFVGIFYASIVTLGVMKPILRLVRGTNDLYTGDLSINLPVTTRDEIGEMTDFFNTMVQEIREKEHIKKTFGQFVDPRIVDELIKRSGPSTEKGAERSMTILFSDVAGFSSISELLTADGLVNLINNYLTLASEPIIRFQGVIDKYIGDAVMAFWGEPFTDPERYAQLACDAALEQFVQLEKLRRKLPDLMGIRKGLPQLDIRIGLASGPVIAGNIGSQELQSYTVVGDAVKLAETLETSNKMFGTRILICNQTYLMVKDEFETREIGTIETDQKSQYMVVHELLSRKGECDHQLKELRDIFESGLHQFHDHQLSSAQKLFSNCLQIKPNDPPSLFYLDKIAQLEQNKGEKQ
ncbi:MAG: adenylate/guanylate cyclase domain-containing protein [SAR324 cluster bacterium]|nr:adenylate/guanylate cyclase domain-containing protein [SAR324 cluster bacterium]